MAKQKCKNCGHGKECHAPNGKKGGDYDGECCVIYKYYKNPEDRKNNPINYELKSCMCEEFVEWLIWEKY